MTRFAPSAASASAAAKPIPFVAPVMRICLSFTAVCTKNLIRIDCATESPKRQRR
jgi:hypothetical protein